MRFIPRALASRKPLYFTCAPANNSRLATVIAKAKAANMPNDNIKRTIDKALGSGMNEGVSLLFQRRQYIAKDVGAGVDLKDLVLYPPMRATAPPVWR